jgi:formylglycine-generating enzyme required for sulfatase activity
MICPYCVQEIPAGSDKHDECKENKGKPFSPFYIDHHGGEDSIDPVVVSVVGFRQHGKTVFLCALFDFLDNHLHQSWPGFYNHVLDQDSLTQLNETREDLRKGNLPNWTILSFPRPGIFRLTNMPRRNGGGKLPPLDDTSVLIYDPPGEAFVSEDQIVLLASFVKRSSCVLFLIDITSLGDAIADETAKLLDTYLLGMRRMGIAKKSQHLIVVYTKSDEMKASLPEFEGFLEGQPELKNHLNEQRPAALTDPYMYLQHLERISQLLEKFTLTELNAGKFINVARDWFASVNYTIVSSLGAAPEKYFNEAGEERSRMTVRMSPRGVVDPLLFVLANSIKIKKPLDPPPPPPPEPEPFPRWALVAAGSGIALLLIVLLIMYFSNSDAKPQSGKIQPGKLGGETISANLNPPATNGRGSPNVGPVPPGMALVPGGEFEMGRAEGDEFESPPHRVVVKPFFIDLYEVTCEEYTRFIGETGHTHPVGWRGGTYPQGSMRMPVTGVTWYDAAMYARWANKRLPTEQEWEFAARGKDGRIYPWGGEWLPGKANANDSVSGKLAEVGTYDSISPFGAYDMSGNAWEWTASDLKPYPGGRLTVEVAGKDLKVIRGGSWRESPKEATATYRGYLLASGSQDYSATGFRCVRDVPTASMRTAQEISAR